MIFTKKVSAQLHPKSGAYLTLLHTYRWRCWDIFWHFCTIIVESSKYILIFLSSKEKKSTLFWVLPFAYSFMHCIKISAYPYLSVSHQKHLLIMTFLVLQSASIGMEALVRLTLIIRYVIHQRELTVSKYFTQRPAIHHMSPSKAIPIYKILYRPYLYECLFLGIHLRLSLKVTVSRDFWLQVLSWIVFSHAPGYNISDISIFFECSQRYATQCSPPVSTIRWHW